MEQCQEAGSLAACMWEDGWELSNNVQVQFIEHLSVRV